MKRTRTTVITTSVARFEITREDLLKAFNIRPDARIFVTVPGGGNWSNSELDIEETPIEVISTVTETKESET